MAHGAPLPSSLGDGLGPADFGSQSAYWPHPPGLSLGWTCHHPPRALQEGVAEPSLGWFPGCLVRVDDASSKEGRGAGGHPRRLCAPPGAVPGVPAGPPPAPPELHLLERERGRDVLPPAGECRGWCGVQDGGSQCPPRSWPQVLQGPRRAGPHMRKLGRPARPTARAPQGSPPVSEEPRSRFWCWEQEGPDSGKCVGSGTAWTCRSQTPASHCPPRQEQAQSSQGPRAFLVTCRMSPEGAG